MILRIYDILGQQVGELVNAKQTAGWYSVSWNANATEGVSMYRLEAINRNDPNDRFVNVKKMIIMR